MYVLKTCPVLQKHLHSNILSLVIYILQPWRSLRGVFSERFGVTKKGVAKLREVWRSGVAKLRGGWRTRN
jgi:hypothetical protein